MNKLSINTILITFFLLFSSLLKAEIVQELEINGNKRVSEETIKVYGEIKSLNSDFSQFDLDNILNNLYSTNFFEDITIKILNKKLVIDLVEYPLINEIILIGEDNTGIKKKNKRYY